MNVKKVLSIIGIVISAIPLTLFTLFILIIDISGVYSRIGPLSIFDKIGLYFDQRVALLKDILPIARIPLIIAILILVISIIALKKLEKK